MEDSLRAELVDVIHKAVYGPPYPAVWSASSITDAILARFDVRLREPQAEETP